MSRPNLQYVTCAALFFATLIFQGCALKIRGVLATSPSTVVVDSYCLDHLTDTPLAGGTGTPADPYIICTPQQLDQVRNFLTASFILRSDLDLTAFSTGMFGDTVWFSGTFDGNGRVIRNFTINPGLNFVGFFSIVSGTITRLRLENASVTGGAYSGGMVGELKPGGVITESYISGTMTSSFDHGGGLVGTNNGTISKSGSNVTLVNTVGGNQAFGGVVGHNYGPISECYALGNVTAAGIRAGGLVGINDGTISNSFARGNVNSATNESGGLVGNNTGTGVVSNSYSTGTATGPGVNGGLIATNLGVVTNSYWDTQTSGTGVSAGGTGQTTANMQIQGTFASWDFSAPIWKFNSAISIYPILHLAP